MSANMDTPLPPSRWRKGLRIAAVLGGIAVLASFVLSLQPERTFRTKRTAVTLSTVEQGIFHDFVPLRGQVVPRDIVFLDAQEGGRIERIHVQAGDIVTAGQPLIEFGNTQLQLEVIDREARLIEQINYLRSQETALEQARVANERALAEIDYNIVRLSRLLERRNALASNGGLSVEEKEKVADELAYYQRLRPLTIETTARQEQMRIVRLPEIHDGLQKLQQNLQITRSKLDNLIVRAPVSGRLTEMDLKVGQNCERGLRLAEITPDTGYKLSAAVDEFYLRRVRNGQSAVVQIGETEVQLRVIRVYPQVKNGAFTVDLEFNGETPGQLLSGQALQGKLYVGDDSSALILPAGPFLERTGGDWVFVLNEDGESASRRRIRIGRRNAEQVEVLEGLKAGDRVITSDYSGLERIDRVDLTS